MAREVRSICNLVRFIYIRPRHVFGAPQEHTANLESVQGPSCHSHSAWSCCLRCGSNDGEKNLKIFQAIW